MKLFRDWFGGWSDDQKNYLTLRLKDVDEEFFGKYEDYLQNPHPEKKKDYFEPGVPGNYPRRDSPFHARKFREIEHRTFVFKGGLCGIHLGQDDKQICTLQKVSYAKK